PVEPLSVPGVLPGNPASSAAAPAAHPTQAGLPQSVPAVAVEVSAAGRALAAAQGSVSVETQTSVSLNASTAAQPATPVAAPLAAESVARVVAARGSDPSANTATTQVSLASPDRPATNLVPVPGQFGQIDNGGTGGQLSQGQQRDNVALQEVRLSGATPITSTSAAEALPRAETVGFTLEPLDPRIAQVLSRQARLVTNGETQQLTLRLNPPHLGALRVQLTHQAGQVSVAMVAASTEARRMLDAAMPLLRTSLQEQGIQVSRIDVTVRESSPDSSSSQSGGSERGQGQGDSSSSGSSARQRSEGEDGLTFGSYLNPDGLQSEAGDPSAPGALGALGEGLTRVLGRGN
ncbi:MAG: hypothetical protein CL878_05170, partial [Dehalococcoidia bacterium]|nr:hypothetical protein [Dehalococcoidia bacterium]